MPFTPLSIADVSAMQNIRSVLARHSHGVDRAEASRIAQCYHTDASVDYGFFEGSAADLAGMLATAQRQQPISLHRVGQSWINLSGSQAKSESYVIAYAASRTDAPENDRQTLICGRYLDHLTADEGSWKIAHRRYVLDVAVSQKSSSSLLPLTSLASHCPSGGHGASDAGIALLARARAAFSNQKQGNAVMTASAETIDRAISTQQLATLTAAYCRGVDRTDPELLKSLFHEDSVVMTGAFNGNGHEFAVNICDIIRTHFSQAFHSTANQWFDIEGDDAVGESYVIAATTSRGGQSGPSSTLTGGRYIDRFSRRDGKWKFAERHFVCDWVMEHPSNTADGIVDSLPLRGRQDTQDPVYAFWNQTTGSL